MPERISGVVPTICADAREFLNKISPHSDELDGGSIFRGVRSSKFELLPKIFRSMNDEHLSAAVSCSPGALNSQVPELWDKELRLLMSFYDSLQSAGINVPDDDASIRSNLGNQTKNNNWLAAYAKNNLLWPPEVFLGVAALAQHYGLPTRLLDWTKNPYIAAYFAIFPYLTGEVPIIDDEDYIVVYALNSGELDEINTVMGDNARVELVNVASYTNPNLFSQKGCFTVMRLTAEHYGQNFEHLSLNDQISQLLSPELMEKMISAVAMPVEHVWELADLLRRHGICAGSMFPGHRGAALDVLEKIRTRSRKGSA